MRRSARFVIEGKPVPKGSRVQGFTKSGRSYSREANKHVGPWLATVKRELMAQHDGEMFRPPYKVSAVCYFEPPQKPTYPRSSDADKILRGLLDGAVQAKVIEDDRHCIEVSCIKRYGTPARAVLEIEEVDGYESRI